MVRLPMLMRLEVKQVGSHQIDHQHHQRGLEHQAAQHQLVVPDQLEVTGNEHPQLAKEFHWLDWLHRLSASCAASGYCSTTRLNSRVVKYLVR